MDIGFSEFTLVRAHAKLEPSLMNLWLLGGDVAISTIVEIIFFGHDQTGTGIRASGTIGINFADWADPTTEEE